MLLVACCRDGAVSTNSRRFYFSLKSTFLWLLLFTLFKSVLILLILRQYIDDIAIHLLICVVKITTIRSWIHF